MRFGPMGLADYERMLPKGQAFERLKYWVLNYSGEHFFWDVQLVLSAQEVPETRIKDAHLPQIMRRAPSSTGRWNVF